MAKRKPSEAAIARRTEEILSDVDISNRSQSNIIKVIRWARTKAIRELTAGKKANPATATMPRDRWVSGKVMLTKAGKVKIKTTARALGKRANPKVTYSTKVVRGSGNEWVLIKKTRGAGYDGNDRVSFRTKADALAAGKRWKSLKR